MSDRRADQYRRSAEDCRLRAREAKHPEDKARWLKMSEDWQVLAESLEADQERFSRPDPPPPSTEETP